MPETRLRRSMTRLLGFGHLLLCLAWVLPLHGAPQTGRVSFVFQVAANGPVWAVGFGATALVLLVGSWRPLIRGWSWWGHSAGVVVTVAFAGASGTSAIVSRPVGSIVAAVVFLVLAVWHLILQRYYKAGG